VPRSAGGEEACRQARKDRDTGEDRGAAQAQHAAADPDMVGADEVGHRGHAAGIVSRQQPAAPSQLEMWVNGPYFCDGDVSYMSPLDSAATLSVMRTFRAYKSILDEAWFLEVLHASPRWIPSVTVSLVPRTKPFSIIA
jgi:hypothetical protein